MEISNIKELDEAIIVLEKRKAAQQILMKEQFEQVTHSLQPGTLIKSAFNNVMHPSGAKTGIFKTIAGIAAGVLTKKLFIGKSTSLLSKIVGSALKLGVAKTAISNSDKIKAYGVAIYNNLFQRKGNNDTKTF